MKRPSLIRDLMCLRIDIRARGLRYRPEDRTQIRTYLLSYLIYQADIVLLIFLNSQLFLFYRYLYTH